MIVAEPGQILPQDQPPPTPEPVRGKKQWFLVGVIILMLITVALAAFGIIRARQSTRTQNSSLTADPFAFVAPTPTPAEFPFMELTIPYLRKKTYDSRFGELKQVSENTSYTGFVTNYDSDGLTINGLLTIPKGSPEPVEGWPAVVFVHGYIPPTSYRTTVNYLSYVDFLARRGLVVFKIDLRGHDDSEGEASGAYYSSDYIVDTLNAYVALQNAPFVNPAKVGLWGHSMAGNVVFRSYAAMPEIPKVVIWAGAVYSYEDFSQFRIADASYRPPPQESERRRRREELFAAYGEFDPNSEFWRLVPATNFLDGLNGQVQVHHAVNDTVVNIGYSRNLMEILRETEISHELFEYQSGGHNLTGDSFTQAMQRTANFYKM